MHICMYMSSSSLNSTSVHAKTKLLLSLMLCKPQSSMHAQNELVAMFAYKLHASSAVQFLYTYDTCH